MGAKAGNKLSKKSPQQPRQDITGTLAAKESRDIAELDEPSTPRGVDLGPFDPPASAADPIRRLLTPATPEQVEAEKKKRACIDRALGPVWVVVISPPAPTTPAASGTATKPIKSKDWILLHVKRWKKDGKINDRTTQETLSEMIADELSAAKAVGVPVRALTQGYIRSHLADFGIWPISTIK